MLQLFQHNLMVSIIVISQIFLFDSNHLFTHGEVVSSIAILTLFFQFNGLHYFANSQMVSSIAI